MTLGHDCILEKEFLKVTDVDKALQILLQFAAAYEAAKWTCFSIT